MKCLLLSVALIFTVMRATVAVITTDTDVGDCKTAAPQDRLPLHIINPINYDIEFVFFSSHISLSGTCNISIHIFQQTKTVSLHAYKIRIDLDQIQLTKISEATDRAKAYVPVEYRYCKISQTLYLIFKNNLPPAFYNLQLKFLVPLGHDEFKGFNYYESVKWEKSQGLKTQASTILHINLGKVAAASMKRKMQSIASKPSSAKKHWSAGLLSSIEDPESKVTEDDKTIVIKDKYPKAQFHYLVLPKEDILSIWHVKGKHHELLMHMHNIARGLTEKHADHEFIIGYHAMPSMQRLHLHVISTDFVSPCLKTKYHWNSFTTPFFLHSSDVCRQLRETGQIRRVLAEESEGYLATKLKCHKCATQPKNLPQLKKHLLTHVGK